MARVDDTMSEFYQTCGIPKPPPRKLLKGRRMRAQRKSHAEVRQYVFAREKGICRCCRLRPAASMHELKSRGAGGEVSRFNSVAVCGGLVGVEPSCHTYLQSKAIRYMAYEGGAERLLAFFPMTPQAAEWLRVPLHERLESYPMSEVEAEV
jgi:hypothetical protein